MAKKHQLVPRPYSDAVIIGIASPLPDYRLVHFINKNTGLRLAKVSDLLIPEDGKNPAGKYPLFTCHQEEYSFQTCLATNYPQENPMLFSSLKNIDYILLLPDPNPRYDLAGMIGKIRSIKEVMVAQQIDKDRVAGSDKIIGLIELHLNNELQAK